MTWNRNKPNEKIYPHKYPYIIEKSLFDQVQKIRLASTRNPSNTLENHIFIEDYSGVVIAGFQSHQKNTKDTFIITVPNTRANTELNGLQKRISLNKLEMFLRNYKYQIMF
jgi:hypothetical protein